MEQRQCPRFPVHFQSTFSSANTVGGQGSVLDLSIRGCRIDSATKVAPGTTLGVGIQIDSVEPPVKIRQAVVRWVRHNQFGLEFETLDPEEWLRLQAVVKRIEMEPYQRDAQSPPSGS